MTKEEAYNKAKEYFMKYYRKDIDKLTIADSKGYWHDSEGYTYYYAEHGSRDKYGRFISPYRVWEILKGKM